MFRRGMEAMLCGFDYLTYSFLYEELLYDPSAFQDLFSIIRYWQLTDI
jgi:hypothetical protein